MGTALPQSRRAPGPEMAAAGWHPLDRAELQEELQRLSSSADGGHAPVDEPAGPRSQTAEASPKVSDRGERPQAERSC